GGDERGAGEATGNGFVVVLPHVSERSYTRRAALLSFREPMRGLQFHNDALQSLHRPQRYDLSDIDAIDGVLRAHGTLAFSALPTGLYAASPDAVSSGYDNVWVRDNVYVAFAQWEAGRRAEAICAAQTQRRLA